MAIRDYEDTLDEDERNDIRERLVKVVDCDQDEAIRRKFPNIIDAECKVTSKADPQFNCLSYVLGDKENWWWPSTLYYWPGHFPYRETIENFAAFFVSLGYELCEDVEFERGYEKIAIYARGDKATHVAHQLSSGLWKSKLGRGPDIRHKTLKELESPEPDSPEWQASLDAGYGSPGFGKVAFIMKKSVGETRKPERATRG